ncbi:unnamed protein product [Dovyalis caffra]|uniref:Uncharacterized protein n=1 Tax=Dovyalis caffra TaxID=77055 RepID=A0AAV1SF77_9ROSI|nr:unnamed protein product [Dovyalis caffra]
MGNPHKRFVIRKVKGRDGVPWALGVQTECRVENAEIARGLFQIYQMKAEGENQSTVIMVVAVLSGCADLGALDYGQAIHGYISKVNLD